MVFRVAFSVELLIPENVRTSLKLDAKVCDGLFWNYLSTLQTKLEMGMLNEADENIMAFVRRLVKEKKEMLAYRPPTVYWYSRQG